MVSRSLADSLDNHLADLMSQGEFVGSSDFTLNTLKAAQKLSEYQLPSPSLWVVKFVQAAVAYEASACIVEFHGRRMRVRFQTDISEAQAQQLLSDVLSGKLDQSGGDFHLVSGLRASVAGPTQKWRWQVLGPETRFGVECDEEGIRPLEIDPKELSDECWVVFDTFRPYRFPGFRELMKLPVKHLVSQTSGELMALATHCWCCPVPLLVDGKPLNRSYHPALGLPGNFTAKTSGHINYAAWSLGQSRYNLLHRELPLLRSDLQVPYLYPTQLGKKGMVSHESSRIVRQRVTFRDEFWLRWTSEQVWPGGHLFLLLGTPLQPAVDWVCDGAVVDSTPLPWTGMSRKQQIQVYSGSDAHLSLRFALPAQSSELDLSHFRMRDSENIVQDLLPMLKNITSESLKMTHAETKELRLFHQRRPKLSFFTRFYFLGTMRRRVRTQLEQFLQALEN